MSLKDDENMEDVHVSFKVKSGPMGGSKEVKRSLVLRHT